MNYRDFDRWVVMEVASRVASLAHLNAAYVAMESREDAVTNALVVSVAGYEITIPRRFISRLQQDDPKDVSELLVNNYILPQMFPFGF